MTNVGHLASLARYCRPSTVEDGMPTDDAFWIRPAEEHLSVNVLPGDLGVEAGLVQIRKILAKKRYGTSPNGRLAVFNAGRVVQYMRKYGDMDVRIEHEPAPDDPTHAGIAPADGRDADTWYESKRVMARLLSKIVRENPSSMYPAR